MNVSKLERCCFRNGNSIFPIWVRAIDEELVSCCFWKFNNGADTTLLNIDVPASAAICEVADGY